MSLTAIFSLSSRETIDAALVSTSASRFILFSIVLGALLLIQLLTSSITPYIKTKYMVKLENNLKSAIFLNLLESKIKETESYHTGDLLNHLTSDVRMISDGILDIIPKMIFFVVRFLGAFILLFFIDPLLALIIISLGILLFLGSRLLAKPIKIRHKRLQESESNMRSYVQESLSHIQVIKSFEAEKQMTKKLNKYNDDVLDATLRKQRFSMLTHFGMTGFLTFGYGLAIIMGAMRLSTGALTIGGLTALIQLVGHLQSPFGGISQLIPKYYQLQASLERLQVLDQLDREHISKTLVSTFETITSSHLNFFIPNRTSHSRFIIYHQTSHNSTNYWRIR